MNLPKRQPMRLKDCDYNTPGAYFITICTKDKKNLLSEIVGTGVLDCPKNILSEYGKIANNHITAMNNFYNNISVDKYVIMPNHIHLLLRILHTENGQSGTPVPTKANSVISRFVSTFKRFCNKEYGQNIWQSRSYDHVVRGEQDYKEICEYIDNNPTKWKNDCFYSVGQSDRT